MSDTESQKTSKYLFTIIEGIKSLREGADTCNSPRFKAWHFGAMKKLDRVYGKDSFEMNHFLKINYAPGVNFPDPKSEEEEEMIQSQFQSSFNEGLDQAQEMVMELLRDINIMGAPEDSHEIVETSQGKTGSAQLPFSLNIYNTNTNNNTLNLSNAIYSQLAEKHGQDKIIHLEALVEDLKKDRNNSKLDKLIKFTLKLGYDVFIAMLPTLTQIYFPIK